jgi:UDP-hydrolysing UDP-N-acetyl-D-glucosamine 2-epimerase
MKNICVALTNRTNYSKLKTVLLELKKYPEVTCRIVLSSSILLDRYGNGYQDLLSDGFVIDKRIDCALMNDCHEAMAKTVGLSIIEHSSYFQWRQPDLLIIVGDRFDMLAPAVAAAMMNIPIAHIQGGELSGTIDNVIRDVITRFACLHFVATEQSAKNLINYGVDPSTVYDFGCPAVEYVSQIDVGVNFDPQRLCKMFKSHIDIGSNDQYFLVMIHPDTTNRHDVNMNLVLDAVASFNVKALIFYPNVDANNSEIVASISKYKSNPRFHMIRHMPLEGFIHAMSHCSCMISNSSSGIREAASFGVPVVNIGFRQVDRQRNSNVFDIGNDYKSLPQVIKSVAGKRFDKSNLYLKPNCSTNIAEQIISYLSKSKV